MAKAKGTRKRATNPDMTKAEKFTALATSRVNKAVGAIGSIGHLSNTTQYDYTTAQAKKVIEALEAAVQKVKDRFANPSIKGEGGFSL